jgi:hypothetical protein
VCLCVLCVCVCLCVCVTLQGGGKGVNVLVVAGGVDDCVTKEMCNALHLELLRLGFNSSLVEEESVAHNIVPNLQCEYIGTFLNSLALGGGIDQVGRKNTKFLVFRKIPQSTPQILHPIPIHQIFSPETIASHVWIYTQAYRKTDGKSSTLYPQPSTPNPRRPPNLNHR